MVGMAISSAVNVALKLAIPGNSDAVPSVDKVPNSVQVVNAPPLMNRNEPVALKIVANEYVVPEV